jgi:serine/threonine protein phosphatase PrpC
MPDDPLASKVSGFSSLSDTSPRIAGRTGHVDTEHMRVKFAGLTDVGRTRDNNEDNFFISESEPLCVVADGMGGHNSGEVASLQAIQVVRDFYEGNSSGAESPGRGPLPPWPFKRRPPKHHEERRLVQAVLLANQEVHNAANNDADLKGMGTTLVGAYFIETGMYLIHIGDSRAYRLRDGAVERMTRDHSLADEYLAMGILRPEEVQFFPYKNVITRAIGLSPTVEPEVNFVTILPDDIFLFCSDGLTDPLDDHAIARILQSHRSDLESAARALVDAANEAGGPDNITVVLAHAQPDV